MKFSEAMAIMENGGKVRCKFWGVGLYICMGNSGCVTQDDDWFDIRGSTVKSEWELYDSSVSVDTLKEGDLFSFSGLPGKKYRLLPAYMMEYVKKVREVKECDAPLLPCIGHEGFNKPDLCYIMSNMKVIKS